MGSRWFGNCPQATNEQTIKDAQEAQAAVAQAVVILEELSMPCLHLRVPHSWQSKNDPLTQTHYLQNEILNSLFLLKVGLSDVIPRISL